MRHRGKALAIIIPLVLASTNAFANRNPPQRSQKPFPPPLLSQLEPPRPTSQTQTPVQPPKPIAPALFEESFGDTKVTVTPNSISTGTKISPTFYYETNFDFSRDPIQTVQKSPSHNFILIRTVSDKIAVLSLATFALARTFYEIEEEAIRVTLFSPSGTYSFGKWDCFISHYRNMVVWLKWQEEGEKLLYTHNLLPQDLTGVTFKPNGNALEVWRNGQLETVLWAPPE